MAMQNKLLLLKKKIKKQYVKTGNRPSASCSDPHINVGDIYFIFYPSQQPRVEYNSENSHYKNMTLAQLQHLKRFKQPTLKIN